MPLNNNLFEVISEGGIKKAKPLGGGSGGSDINVIDNLESTSSEDALSANQGRVLNGLITNVSNSVDDLEINIGDTSVLPTTTDTICENIASLSTNLTELKNVITYSGTTTSGGNLILPNEYNVNNCYVIPVEGYLTSEPLTPVYPIIRLHNKETTNNYGFHCLSDGDTVIPVKNTGVTVRFIKIALN